MWYLQLLVGIVLGIIFMFYYSQIIYPIFYFLPKSIYFFIKGKFRFSAVIRSFAAPIIWVAIPLILGFLFPAISESKFYRYISTPEIVLISNLIVIIMILKSVLTVSGRADLKTDFWKTMNKYKKDNLVNDADRYINDAEDKMFLTKDYHGAVEDYNKAISINPNDGIDYYNRGIAKYKLGDRDGACLDWKKAESLGYVEAKSMYKQYC